MPSGGRPLALAAAIAVALTAGAPAAAAQPRASLPRASHPWTLRWRAPASCPDAEAVRAAVADLVGRAPERTLVFDADVRPVEGGFLLTLASTADGQAAGRRTLEAASCEDLAGAAAVVVALAIDPAADVGAAGTGRAAEADAAGGQGAEAGSGAGVAGEAPPGSPGRLDDAAAPRGEGADQPTLAADDDGSGGQGDGVERGADQGVADQGGGDQRGGSATAGRGAVRLAPGGGWLFQVGGALDLGPLPGPALGPSMGGAVRLDVRGRRVEARVEARFQPASSADVPNTASGRADFRLLAATPAVCVDAWARGPWSTGGCLEVDLGALWGGGRGISDPDVGTAFWVAPALGGFLRFRPFPWGAVRLGAALGLAAGARRFVATVGEPPARRLVHEADLVVGRVTLGVEWWPAP